MKRLFIILFLFAALALLPGGCTYYYPLDYASYYPDTPNYGFVGPFIYYSPYGEYSYYEYPYLYSYPYEYYNYPATRFYFGERPGVTERQFERNGSEKESAPPSR